MSKRNFSHMYVHVYLSQYILSVEREKKLKI